ncbi:probable cytochrome P450 49a1 isoform X2 [Eriocheir sinensis]|nr:probable cytochrome P450 49a1 isoform X2 [Eriocheir sinensis]
MLQNPEDIKTILNATMINPYREPIGCIRKIRYDDDYYEKKCGLVAENGEEWYRVSSLLRPKVLRMDNLHPYLPQMDQVTLDFLNRISSLRDTRGEITVDFKDELERWALECVCLISMNQRLGCLEPSLKSGSEQELIWHAAKNLFPYVEECETGSKLWKFYPNKPYKQVQHCMEKLKETSEAVLKEAELEMKLKLEKDPNARLSMLEQCLVQPGLTRKDIVMFMIDLIAGGTDTVANMAGVILYLLAKNPEVQAKLQEEVDKVLGDDTGPLTQRHLDQLSYLKAVVKEANRVLPILLGPVRTLQEDVRLGNFLLHKGWMLLLMSAFSGWDAKEIQHPQDFLPERWLRHRPYGSIHPCASIPFSFGSRMCIGRRIAEQEIYIFLARMFQRYTLEWKYGELERTLKQLFSPKGPLKFTFMDR